MSLAKYYTFSLGTDQYNIQKIADINEPSYYIEGLEKGMTYFWRFSILDNCNHGCISGTMKFTVIPDTSLPLVYTSRIPPHLYTCAPLGGDVVYEGLSDVTEKGVYWGINPEPEKTGVKILSGSGTGKYLSMVTGLEKSRKYYVKAFATNSYGTYYGKETEFYTGTDPIEGEVKDIEGNSYRTIKIGDQIWMAENLRTTRMNDYANIFDANEKSSWTNSGLNIYTPKYSWYNGDTVNKRKYGLIYNGNAAYSGKICPTGWHLPSDDEWKILETYLGMSASAIGLEYVRGYDEGSQLKNNSGWLDQGDGYNTVLFGGLPGGARDYAGTYWGQGNTGRWWSSTKDLRDRFLLTRALISSKSGISRDLYSMQYGCSIRCLKDHN